MPDSMLTKFLRFSVDLGFPDSPARVVKRAEKLLKQAFGARSCKIHLSTSSPASPTVEKGSIRIPLLERKRRIGVCELKGVKHCSTSSRSLLEKLCAETAARTALAAYKERLIDGSENVIKAFSTGMDFYDRFTEQHSEAVRDYAAAIAGEMGMSRSGIKDLVRAAHLHDIGKVGISPRIINKKHKLSSEDWKEIKKHPMVAKTILDGAESLRGLIPAIVYHHERYDGKGYPCGLQKDEIPVHARILGAADSYATMMANRPYRKAMSFDRAVRTLIRSSGTRFDPKVVKALLKVLRKRST